MSACLIVGAGGGIGGALAQQCLESPTVDEVVAISSQPSPPAELSASLKWLHCDYSESGIKAAVDSLSGHQGKIDLCFICNGMLHDAQIQPEKRLEDFSPEAFHRLIAVNTTTPFLWIKHLRGLLAGRQTCRVGVLSARVGSISDNRLGGWYSYRASKAALNMLLKSAAIEYARRAENVKLVALHPGTTDTALSAPFQKNVPKGKLFDPSWVAERLIDVLNSAPLDNEASFLDWQGLSIGW